MKDTVRSSLNARVDSLLTGLFFFTIRQKLIWKILVHRNANCFFPVELRASKFTAYDPVKHRPVFCTACDPASHQMACTYLGSQMLFGPILNFTALHVKELNKIWETYPFNIWMKGMVLSFWKLYFNRQLTSASKDLVSFSVRRC